jgi:hypothetical protein
MFMNTADMLTSIVYNFGDIAMFGHAAWAVALMFLSLAAIFAAWALKLPRDFRREEWLPLYVIAPLLAGLFVHAVLAAVAYRADIGVTPGRYIDVAAPALALILGAGLSSLSAKPLGKVLMASLLAGAFALNIWILLLRFELFGGCVSVAPDYSSFSTDRCTALIVYDRLPVLGYPAGLACIVLALLMFSGAAVTAICRLSRASQ